MLLTVPFPFSSFASGINHLCALFSQLNIHLSSHFPNSIYPSICNPYAISQKFLNYPTGSNGLLWRNLVALYFYFFCLFILLFIYSINIFIHSVRNSTKNFPLWVLHVPDGHSCVLFPFFLAHGLHSLFIPTLLISSKLPKQQ